MLWLGRRRGSRADAGVGIASLYWFERDRAEGKSSQFRLAPAARLPWLSRSGQARVAGQAPACGRLNDQDGQLPVTQVAFPRPCPQRLDDVGDMVSAGVRLPVSVPRARCLKLNLEARHVLACGIRVAATRRRPVVWWNHVPPGSPGALQSDGIRRAVIEGVPPWKAWQKDVPPVTSARAVAVNVTTARRRGKLRGGHGPSVRSNIVRTGMLYATSLGIFVSVFT